MESINSFVKPPVYNQDGRMGQILTAAKTIGNNVQESHTKYINLYNQFNSERDSVTKTVGMGDVEAASEVYKADVRILEMFSSMMKSMHDQLMSLIRRLAN